MPFMTMVLKLRDMTIVTIALASGLFGECRAIKVFAT